MKKGKMILAMIIPAMLILVMTPLASAWAPTVTIDITDPINLSNVTSVPVTITSDYAGTYTYTISDEDEGTADITGGGDIIADTPVELSLDLSSLSDGTITADALVDVEGIIGYAQQDTATKDTVPPTVTITSTAPNPTNTSPIPMTATFSEDVTGFVSGIIVGNGAAGDLAGSGAVYTFDVTPTDQGAVTVDIAAEVAQDAAGNPNTVAEQFSITYDTVPPTVTITVSDILINEDDAGFTFDVVATFSEPMDTETTPAIAFDPDVEESETLTFLDDDWTAEDTVYTATYTIADEDEEAPDVDVSVSGAQDLAGNVQDPDPTTAYDLFDVDTKAPDVDIDIPEIINMYNVDSFPVIIGSDEDGTYTCTIEDDDEGTVTDSGPITAGTPVELSLDLSGLADGEIDAYADVTDAAGNTGDTGDELEKDTVPPTIEDAIAAPDMVSLITGTGGMSTGPDHTYLFVEAYGVGEHTVYLNFRPMLEQMFANVEFDGEEAMDFLELLEDCEEVSMDRYSESLWCHDFESWDPIDWFIDEVDMDDRDLERIISEEIVLGDFTIPVTAVDWVGNESYSTIELAIVDIQVPLEEGWNLRSTPVALANPSWGNIVSLGQGDSLSCDVALRLDVETQEWEVMDSDYPLSPLEAIYIHMTEMDQMGLIFSRDLTAPPMRELGAGWNLVGYAPPVDTIWFWLSGGADFSWDEMHVREAMITAEKTPDGNTGYDIVISPSEDLYYDEHFGHMVRSYVSYTDYYYGGSGYFKGYFDGEVWDCSVEGDIDGEFEGYLDGYFKGYIGGEYYDGLIEGEFYDNFEGYYNGYVEYGNFTGYKDDWFSGCIHGDFEGLFGYWECFREYEKYFDQESWVYTAIPLEYDVQWQEGQDMAQVNGYCGDYYDGYFEGYFEGLIYGYPYEGYYGGYIYGPVNGSLEGYFYGDYEGYFDGYFEGWFYGELDGYEYYGYYDDHYEGYVDGYIDGGYLTGSEAHWEYIYDCYMQPFCGYKVFMENPDLLAGFNETPLTWEWD